MAWVPCVEILVYLKGPLGVQDFPQCYPAVLLIPILAFCCQASTNQHVELRSTNGGIILTWLSLEAKALVCAVAELSMVSDKVMNRYIIFYV